MEDAVSGSTVIVDDVEAAHRMPQSADSGMVRNQHADSRKDHAERGLEDVVADGFEQFVAYMDRDLKPYFEHLDTRTFLRRCVRSVFPTTKYEDILRNPDFYAPLVLTFALSSCLHFAFKKADPAPLDRHLGTSLLVCFGSLVAGSLLLDVAWQYSSTMLRQGPAKYGLDRACCILGYSFFGPCLIMLLDGRLWDFLFIPLALLVETGAAMSFGTAAFRASQAQNPALGIVSALLHMIWLYNLRAMLRTFDSVVVDFAAG